MIKTVQLTKEQTCRISNTEYSSCRNKASLVSFHSQIYDARCRIVKSPLHKSPQPSPAHFIGAALVFKSYGRGRKWNTGVSPNKLTAK